MLWSCYGGNGKFGSVLSIAERFSSVDCLIHGLNLDHHVRIAQLLSGKSSYILLEHPQNYSSLI